MGLRTRSSGRTFSAPSCTASNLSCRTFEVPTLTWTKANDVQHSWLAVGTTWPPSSRRRGSAARSFARSFASCGPSRSGSGRRSRTEKPVPSRYPSSFIVSEGPARVLRRSATGSAKAKKPSKKRGLLSGLQWRRYLPPTLARLHHQAPRTPKLLRPPDFRCFSADWPRLHLSCCLSAVVPATKCRPSPHVAASWRPDSGASGKSWRNPTTTAATITTTARAAATSSTTPPRREPPQQQQQQQQPRCRVRPPSADKLQVVADSDSGEV
mmetsp:Transcript_28176/g.42566  ORF Transcript_28176/g.42566 Transcript_28176/m.42566 type:complete len:268 (-) Transcript_28176:77-880(-)